MQIIHPDLGVYIHSNHIEIFAKVQLQLKFHRKKKSTTEDIHLDLKRAALKDARATSHNEKLNLL